MFINKTTENCHIHSSCKHQQQKNCSSTKRRKIHIAICQIILKLKIHLYLKNEAQEFGEWRYLDSMLSQ